MTDGNQRHCKYHPTLKLLRLVIQAGRALAAHEIKDGNCRDSKTDHRELVNARTEGHLTEVRDIVQCSVVRHHAAESIYLDSIEGLQRCNRLRPIERPQPARISFGGRHQAHEHTASVHADICNALIGEASKSD